MRLYSAYLLIGFILIFASENNASTTTEDFDYSSDHFQNRDGTYCRMNDTHATERHLSDLLTIAASGAFPFLATKTALAGLGFTSAGIAKGSFAAAWMSKLAIASGGGVAHGSNVAILQALGATGLGGLAAPLVIGGTVVGSAYVYRKEIMNAWNNREQWQETVEEVFENENVQKVKSAISAGAEKVADLASDLKQKAIEELPQMKEKINTATKYATDTATTFAKSVSQKVSKSETVNNVKSRVQQLTERLKNLGRAN